MAEAIDAARRSRSRPRGGDRRRGLAAGVVGIVAAKLVDRYQRPAFVVGIDPETGIGRGSARTRRRRRTCTARCARPRPGSTATAATPRRPGSRCGARRSRRSASRSARRAPGSPPAPARSRRGATSTPRSGSPRSTSGSPQELAGLGPFGQDNPSPVLVTRNVPGLRGAPGRRRLAPEAHAGGRSVHDPHGDRLPARRPRGRGRRARRCRVPAHGLDLAGPAQRRARAVRPRDRVVAILAAPARCDAPAATVVATLVAPVWPRGRRRAIRIGVTSPGREPPPSDPGARPGPAAQPAGDAVPRLPRGRGMRFFRFELFRIAGLAILLVFLLAAQRPCANAVSSFVTSFGDGGSAAATLPRPGTVDLPAGSAGGDSAATSSCGRA